MGHSLSHAVIVNVADLGRSPRAQFHAASLARNGWRVTILAAPGSALFSEVGENPNIEVVSVPGFGVVGEGGLLRKSWAWGRGLARALAALEWNPEWVWVMSPPAVPVFQVVRRWVRGRTGVRVLVDWHNLGYTRLANRLGDHHSWVRCYRFLELGKWSADTHHLTVSDALRGQLMTLGVGPEVAVLTDCNPSWRSFPVRDRTSFLARWGARFPHLDAASIWIVHPHSWSSDESPEWTLDLLDRIGIDVNVQFMITGDGPRREAFARQLQENGIPERAVTLAFLPPEGYVDLLANADWGLCPHTSSSGLDLPMKLADMRGAGLPALVYRYGPVLDEIFAEPDDGVFFRSIDELEARVRSIASGDLLPPTPGRGSHWEEQWDKIVLPRLIA